MILNARQKHIMRTLANTHSALQTQLSDRFGSKITTSLIEMGFIETRKVAFGELGNKYVCTLTTKGADHARAYLCGGNGLYKGSGLQLEHDIKLAEKYLSLKKDERLTWLHENALKKYYKNPDLKIDGAYWPSGKIGVGDIVGVESISRNYSRELIAEKQSQCEQNFNSWEFI